MSSASDKFAVKVWHSCKGQATVEAAFALPVLVVLVLLLLQPGIVLYDRIVMQGAAADGCRLLCTSGQDGEDSSEEYMRRRLSAVPQIDQFHVHASGCSWNIELLGNEASSEVKVKITNELKPLPLVDFGMTLAGLVNGDGNLVIEVESSAHMQPDWLEASEEGRNPSGWVGI